MTEPRDVIAAHLDGLRDGEWDITSQKDPKYNCVAWAADNDQTRWWQPPPYNPMTRAAWYWPVGAPTTGTLDDYAWVFENILAYERCSSPDAEAGFERVVLFESQDGERMHAARRVEFGRWESKLGKGWDIEHDELEAVAGTWAGMPTIFLRRKLPAEPTVLLPSQR